MEDQVCPRCRTTKYRNPSLKLLVNVCGHSLCESCVDLLFLKGSGSCPECDTPLRRSNFRLQMFEDPGVEKEVDVRKRVLREYNKREEEFLTLEEYNDYLEEVEEIVFNLTNGVDVAETTKRMEAYKKENRESILRNKARSGRLESELEGIIEEEKRTLEKRRFDTEKEELEVKKRKVRVKEALLDELMFSTSNASAIVQQFARRKGGAAAGGGGGGGTERGGSGGDEGVESSGATGGGGSGGGGGGSGPKRATAFSTGIKFTAVVGSGCELGVGSGGSLPLPKPQEGPLFVYQAPRQNFQGPSPPRKDLILTGQYLAYMRAESVEEKAGGFEMALACMRAMQESVAGLYHNPVSASAAVS